MNFIDVINSGKFINREPFRAHYVPHLLSDKKGESSLVTLLNGTWKIKKYESISCVPEDFYLDAPRKKIPVPSSVQIHGLDGLQYTNVRYPFPYNPPHSPAKNPAYHYRRTFTLENNDREKFLVFDGVDSNFFLYVNGNFVGYSLISHSMSEFNVSNYLVEGKNVIDVLVTKWCFGSYLEDQDKLRYTGIFRDVYLLERGKKRVVDYRLSTSIDGADGIVIFENTMGSECVVTLNGESKSVEEGGLVTFRISDAKLWSAEEPNLYDAKIATSDEVIYEKVGVREIKIENGVFKINGKHVKLLGVNHHDTHPDFGQTLPAGYLRKELELMKSLNVNCVRTSHYPSVPELYYLCDELGLYVVDEADVEAHGVLHRLGDYLEEEFHLIALDERFKEQISLRAESLVKRDVNRSSIVMWSLGNEAGNGENFRNSATTVRRLDSSRPVHYEGATAWAQDFNEDYVDIKSTMYAPISYMQQYVQREDQNKPFFQCEYAHAMGNSPGDLKDYVDAFYSSDRFMGGCIWEWADHGIRNKKQGGFFYGGDFGENLHDGEFCVDGLVTQDREIKPGALEMKKVYEPAVILLNGNVLSITSRKIFTVLEGKLTLTYKTFGNIEKVDVKDISVKPGETLEITVDNFSTLIASIIVNDSMIGEYEAVKEGYTSFELPEIIKNHSINTVICKDKTRYIVHVGDFEYVLSDYTCGLVSAKKRGKEYIKEEFVPGCYRPYINNDKYLLPIWLNCLRLPFTRSERFTSKIEGNGITFTGGVVADSLVPHAEYTLHYEFFADSIDVTFSYKVADNVNYLPKIGFNGAFNKSLSLVEFFGMGPTEAYVDKKNYAVKDLYRSTVRDEYTDYCYPQECGSHIDTNYLKLASSSRSVEFRGAFAFSALPYSVKEIDRAKHSFELGASKATYLSLDYFTSGVGSGACGPELAEKYRTPKAGEMRFNVKFN